MAPHFPSRRPGVAADADRPWAFLASSADDPAARAWLDGLAPAIARLGDLRRIDRPESRLTFLADQADRAGARPVQLAFGRPNTCYLTPAVPTALFATWHYPDIPAREFGQIDTRQNWKRTCDVADLVVVPDAPTAAAFRRAGVACPVAVVPIPVDPAHAELPDWEPGLSWSAECRHFVLGGGKAHRSLNLRLKPGERPKPGPEPDPEPKVEAEAAPRPAAPKAPARPSLKRRAWMAGRHAFHQFSPYLPDKTRLRIDWTRRRVLYVFGKAPGTLHDLPGGRPTLKRLALGVARHGFDRLVRRWLSDEAMHHVRRGRNLLYRIARKPVPRRAEPEVPSGPLTVSGLVYLAALDPGDPRENVAGLVSAFAFAFRDRADAALVIRMTGPASGRGDAADAVEQAFGDLKLDRPRCRIVVIADDLDDAQVAGLLRVSAFVATATLADGEALPLRRALAGGRPAIAPAHSAPGELVDARVGFPVASHPEPAAWPGDPDGRPDTSWHRPVWSGLRDAFERSAALIDADRAGYAAMSAAARRRMEEVAGPGAVAEALAEALARIEPAEIGAFAWSG